METCNLPIQIISSSQRRPTRRQLRLFGETLDEEVRGGRDIRLHVRVLSGSGSGGGGCGGHLAFLVDVLSEGRVGGHVCRSLVTQVSPGRCVEEGK